jgi:hypothetical protein
MASNREYNAPEAVVREIAERDTTRRAEANMLNFDVRFGRLEVGTSSQHEHETCCFVSPLLVVGEERKGK